MNWAHLEMLEANRSQKKPGEVKTFEFLIYRSQVRALPWTPTISASDIRKLTRTATHSPRERNAMGGVP